MLRSRFLTVLILLAALVALSSAPVAAQQKANLVFSSGPTGGSWTPMAGGFGPPQTRMAA